MRMSTAKKRKVHKDKWEALAEEREKNKPTVKPALDLSKPNEELIAKMLE